MFGTRSVRWFVVVAWSSIFVPGAALAEVASSSAHRFAFNGFDSLIVSGDIIDGLSEEPLGIGSPGVYENPGDLGWHPANPASTNGSQDPHGLPTFTDGQGGVAALAGLLNENFIIDGTMPLSGAPVKVIEYVLAEPTDIGRINVLTGNRNNSDGRIFSTFVVNYSTDGGNIFHELGYFQSDPSGTVNSETNPVPPLSPAQAVTIATVFDNASTTLLSGVTNLEFMFFAVDNTQGELRDPFDGVNSYTGIDDELSAAFVSPLVWEIDVVAPDPLHPGDYNRDGTVSAADYVVWRNMLGEAVTAGEGADGDGNGVVDDVDYVVWTLYFGATTMPGGGQSTSVPEPSCGFMLLIAAVLGAGQRRRVA